MTQNNAANMKKGCPRQETMSPDRRQHLFQHMASHVNVLLRILACTFFLTSISTITFLNTNAPLARAVANGQALTPPMGWSSWNAHFANIDVSIIESAANAVVSSGMKAAGYQYINTDEGWWSGARDANGNITVDQARWPGGMQALATYIHSKGLKAGIYTDAGANGCGGSNQGSYGHYDQDMLQFEQWGFDYVKVDWCGGRELGLDQATQYGQVRDAIAKATAQTGHPMGFSICGWGLSDPWMWGPTTGNIWRTSTDISGSQNSVSWNGILKNFDSATLHANAQAVGSYNDPDMMEVGVPGISDTESQSHFSLWAIAGAPLLAGNDITTMSATTQATLTNSEVIAVDQDPLDLQGIKVSEPTPGLQTWSKVLNTAGQRAIALFNRTGSATNITVNWSDIGLAAGSAQVRDLWAHSNLGSFNDGYTTQVPSHGVTMLKISGTEATQTVYEAESTANTLSNGAVIRSCSACSGGQDVGNIGNGSGNNGTLQFNAIAANLSGPQVITIYYINADSTARTATMSVNGGTTSTVNFPSTGGSWSNPVVGSVKLTVNLNPRNNTIKFSNSSAWAPDFDKLTALPAGNINSYEAEAANNTFGGSAVVNSCASCSGGQDVGNIGNGGGGNGTLQFNNVNAASAGSHKLIISYINGDTSTYGIGSSRTASISVNGGATFDVSFPTTGDWSEVVTLNIAVNLNAGNNTIKFSNGSAWTPDLDRLDVA